MTTTTTKPTIELLLNYYRDQTIQTDRELAAALEAIQRQAAAGNGAVSLEAKVQQLYAAEQQIQLLVNLVSVGEWGIKSGQSDAEIRAALKDELLQAAVRGADDKWSGRNNDLRRTGHDAVLSLIQQLRHSL